MAALTIMGALLTRKPGPAYRLCPLQGATHLCVAIALAAFPASLLGTNHRAIRLAHGCAAAAQAAGLK